MTWAHFVTASDLTLSNKGTTGGSNNYLYDKEIIIYYKETIAKNLMLYFQMSLSYGELCIMMKFDLSIYVSVMFLKCQGHLPTFYKQSQMF